MSGVFTQFRRKGQQTRHTDPRHKSNRRKQPDYWRHPVIKSLVPMEHAQFSSHGKSLVIWNMQRRKR